MRILLSLFLLLFLVCCVTVSDGSSIPTLNLNDESVMYINGTIFYKQVELLRSRRKTVKYLILNSPGGGMDEAYVLSLMVKYNGIITIIPQNGICQSACTLVFQAGKERHASKTSTLMYHGARLGTRVMNAYFKECPTVTDQCLEIFEEMKTSVKSSTMTMFKNLEKDGLSHNVFLKFLKQLPDLNWLKVGNLTGYEDLNMTAEESIQYNAVTHIIEYTLINE